MGRTAGAAGTAGDSSDFQNLLEALVSPPSSVCIRYTGAGVTGVTGGYALLAARGTRTRLVRAAANDP